MRIVELMPIGIIIYDPVKLVKVNDSQFPFGAYVKEIKPIK